MRLLRRTLAAALVAFALARALSVARLWPVSRYVVDGPSMEPAYHDGDRLLVNRLAYQRNSPNVGDVVVLRDPERPGHLLLKRIATAPGPRPGPSAIWVVGDNSAASRDSRTFGAVPRSLIVGKAWRRY